MRENVTLGFAPNEISDQDIWDALEFAQISNFINNLPYGLDTNVGDRGTRLSGGQKQRLGIARTMITKPKLLVLDEATSALDAETESAITEALKNLKGKLTMIVIAHRLSTIMNADIIVVMKNGKIIQMGSHRDLITEGGEYQRLWDFQKGGYVTESFEHEAKEEGNDEE